MDRRPNRPCGGSFESPEFWGIDGTASIRRHDGEHPGRSTARGLFRSIELSNAAQRSTSCRAAAPTRGTAVRSTRAATISTTRAAPGSGYVLTAATASNWRWNVTVEHEIVPNTTVEVSYVGNQGNDLRAAYDVNQVRAGDINRNGINDRLEYARSPTADVRPYGVFGHRSITMWDNHGYSTYHALQTEVLSRFGRSRLQGSYTWSRTISTDPLDNFGGGYVTDLDSPSLDRGLAGTHRTHAFNTSLVLFLPSPQTGSRLVRNLLGNWEIATIASAASGTPVTILT